LIEADPQGYLQEGREEVLTKLIDSQRELLKEGPLFPPPDE
jgi:hypothetical protein